jgi:hypothetical protein
MMSTAKDWPRFDAADSLDRSPGWRILVQGKMRSGAVSQNLRMTFSGRTRLPRAYADYLLAAPLYRLPSCALATRESAAASSTLRTTISRWKSPFL